MLLPEPIVVQLASDRLGSATSWTTYVTPASLWKSLPVSIGWAGSPPSMILDASAVAALDLAGRSWAIPACSAARFVIVSSTAAIAKPLEADGRNEVIVHVGDWPSPLAGGAAAHTVIYAEGDTIVEADIHVNARDFGFTDGSGVGVDLRSILTHELGHVLGIGHSADPRATMSAGLPAGLAGRSLEADDTAAVCTLYPSTDPSAHGCESGCPTGFTCIGFACERGEPGTNGAACSDTPRMCEGAGDTARCIATSDGDRCAPLCAVVPCGNGQKCVAFADDRRCIAVSESIDAGPSDVGVPDAGTPPSPSSSGSGCSTDGRRSSSAWIALFLAISIARRRVSERL